MLLDSQYVNLPMTMGLIPKVTFRNEAGNLELDLYLQENVKKIIAIAALIFFALVPYFVTADIIATALQKVFEVLAPDKRIEDTAKKALS